MLTVTDQMGREVVFSYPPKRIISLVPSQSELLLDLDLEDEIVGVTKFCIYPKDKVRSKAKVGGTKKFDFEIIDDLNPDLILGNKEENYKEGIEKLAEKYPVWMSDIESLNGALEMIKSVGTITDRKEKAHDLVKTIQNSFGNYKSGIETATVLYLIWRDPYMSIGGDTFINDMLSRAGFENILKDKKRFPALSFADIKNLSPEFIFLSSEPFPFKEKHIKEFQDLCPCSKIRLVDGEMFSWFGSRLVHSSDYFRHIMIL